MKRNENRILTGNKWLLPALLFTCAFVFLFFPGPADAQEGITYQKPPKEMVDLVDAPASPMVTLSPDKEHIVLIKRSLLMSLEELAQPELQLAGLRFNPKTNGMSRVMYYESMEIKNLKTLKQYPLTGLPGNRPLVSNFSWSPDGRYIGFIITSGEGLELWVGDVRAGNCKRSCNEVLNNVIIRSYRWLPDSKHIVFSGVVKGRGPAPVKKPVPLGPEVQDNAGGKVAPVQTYQDLLKSKYDEEVFSYYATSQLYILNVEDAGSVKTVGKPGIISQASPSPDGKYLMVSSIIPPFSYLVPYRLFPTVVEIWDMEGNIVKTIANIPLTEDIPKGQDAVQKGPRDFMWRGDAPAALYWVEAQDGGDPAKNVEIRDKIYYLEAPFSGQVKQGPALENRFMDITWGSGSTAILSEFWWKTRREVTWLYQPDFPGKAPKVIFNRSSEDQYTNPGFFVTTPNSRGQYLLLTDKSGKTLYLEGEGASPEGNHPFLDSFDLKSFKTRRLFRSTDPYYETLYAVLDINSLKILISREGKKSAPNYYVKNLKNGKLDQVTFFPHPYPALKDIEKQIIKYKRADGVELSGGLYLPIGYKKTDGPLPVLIWAYPSEFKTKSAAGQLTDSPYRFPYLSGTSPLVWITQGYAVLDDASMPIIGEAKQEPNDTYIEQLVADAQAAIDKLVEMGVGDRKRVAISGHSYGAFMTANLLAHSRLFAAGIARSGAYNRTLTPFGFQNEDRTLWDAPETYLKMSPFMYAHQVKDPILLIHGLMDNNTGTFTIQTERFYHALKGHGATARMVLLPYESHGYRARESILHVLWETYQWLEKYVKNKK